jgi:hypothetical protein
MDWKQIVKSAGGVIGAIAPAIGTALGGPLGGMAGMAIKGIFGLGDDATEEDITRAINGATPDQLLALKQADSDFKIKAAQLGVNLEEIASRDRDSARSREIKLGGSWTVTILAWAIIAGFLGMVAWIVTKGLSGMDATQMGLVGTLVGYVSAKAEQVVSYYFGSSAGSAAKNDSISKMLEQK